MSDQHILAALRARLVSFAQTKGLNLAAEGVAFTPDATKTHLADHLLPAETENPSMGRDHRRYVGIYQVDVDAPASSNVADLRKLANDLVAHFPRGVALTHASSGTKVLIIRTPSISPVLPDGGRMKRAVSIRYQADIIT